MNVPPPPKLADLRAGTVLVAGAGHTTILPTMDFETYSEAGFVWNEAAGKWKRPHGVNGNKTGLGIVGAAVYTEHPTAEVISLSYDLRDNCGVRRWRPGMPPPHDLFEHLAFGGLIEAHNSGFEHWVWANICVPKYGWPPLPLTQLRCSMAKARASGYPGGLAELSDVLNLTNPKDAEGKRLLKKFSVPQNPSKKDPRKRIHPSEDWEDAERLYAYNDRDVDAESEASSLLPDLIPDELEFWQIDQEINYRGCAVDTVAVNNCLAIIEQAYERYNTELDTITGHTVEQASQLERLKGWLGARGVYMREMDEDAIDATLERTDLDPLARRALEIRGLVGSASVKKLYALLHQTTAVGRVHDLFSFHGARTGRATGNASQPQNLPKGGPEVALCSTCKHWSNAGHVCPWCGGICGPPREWNPAAIEDALTVIASRSIDLVEMFFGNAVLLVSGCIRGLFVAAEGHDLLASDFTAIEAVVTAALAGEQWRLEVFATHGKIYETSASKVTGIPFDEYLAYRKRTGQHHPTRQPVGKCLELACGYGGWVNATKATNIRMDRFFSDDEIKGHIRNWRKESPAIVELWGGQHRGWPSDYNYRKEYFGLEGMAILAVLNPGQEFTYCAPHPLARPITYFMRGDALYCRLPSGRLLTYHNPRLTPSTREWAPDDLELSYMGWNTNPKMGPLGWVRMKTYGGKLTENVVQAVARDILAYAMIQLTKAGYPIVLHVHDEIVAEILKTYGSIEEFERIMSTMPWWCVGWPVKASGGWRGRRYRKD